MLNYVVTCPGADQPVFFGPSPPTPSALCAYDRSDGQAVEIAACDQDALRWNGPQEAICVGGDLADLRSGSYAHAGVAAGTDGETCVLSGLSVAPGAGTWVLATFVDCPNADTEKAGGMRPDVRLLRIDRIWR